ncbi:stress-activated map kinase-interacting protein 1 isoform X2 [Onthophagus taurus]|uniref:stress-activated map kinase-interacting protein 1 isoform X2 n=1 Tax=Onthophagus taurus TaxID=166361 RepID=UPI000C20D98D|nr:stress-activated map kinase-interacting protein 1 isoform X2 [Onthophagus taurus]
MALYDNKYWLLSHIRNSFISTDDTVMVGEDLPKKLLESRGYTDPDNSSDEDDEVEHESYDLQFDTQFSRLRSDVTVRMEKMALAKKRAAKIKQVKWDSNPPELDNTDVIDLFSKKEIKNVSPQKSLLTIQVLNSSNLPRNPFTEYAKFDGSAQIGIPTRRFKIFLTMLPEEQRNYPMVVCCIAAAKISEFIGLILLKCSTIHGHIQLKSPSHYGLYLTEEDGEIEAFPCLDAKESVAKYSFTHLSLVKKAKEERNEDEESVQAEDLPVIEVRDSPLQESVGMKLMEVHDTAMESQLYKSFQVYILSKVRPKVEIHLGISGEKIEIDPVQQKNSKFPFVRQKAVSYHMDSIACCDIVDAKSNRAVFRIVYSAIDPANSGSFGQTMNFKHYDFESDLNTAKAIAQKINQILEIRSSVSRKEYNELRERKLKIKRFSLNK